MAENKNTEIEIPEAHESLPSEVAKQWRTEYASGYKAAKAEAPDAGENVLSAAATKAANRLLRPDAPESFEDAMELDGWEVLHRAQKVVKGKRVLNVVTIDGKKYTFQVPKGKETKDEPAAAAAAGDASGLK